MPCRLEPMIACQSASSAVQPVRPGDAGAIHQRIDPGQARKTRRDRLRRRRRRRRRSGADWRQPVCEPAISTSSPPPPAGRQRPRQCPRVPPVTTACLHCAVPPPSTGRITPVMNDAASDARNATAAAISRGSAKRPSGTPALVGIGRGNGEPVRVFRRQVADDGVQHRGVCADPARCS